jgi:hypothetical protein
MVTAVVTLNLRYNSSFADVECHISSRASNLYRPDVRLQDKGVHRGSDGTEVVVSKKEIVVVGNCVAYVVNKNNEIIILGT